jgi:site-specific DNA-adenine methylase
VLNKYFERVIAQTDDRSFLCLDPPYDRTGNELHTPWRKDNDHGRLGEALRGHEKWLPYYDAHPGIQEIYRALKLPVPANYSIAKEKSLELREALKPTFPPSAPGSRGIADRLRICVAPGQTPAE